MKLNMFIFGGLLGVLALAPLGSEAGNISNGIYSIAESQKMFITKQEYRYTIQIFGVRNPELVGKKVGKVSDISPVMTYQTERGGKPFYFVTAGMFENYSEAKAALEDVKHYYSDAFIKNTKNVIADIDRAIGADAGVLVAGAVKAKSTEASVLGKQGKYILKRAGKAPVITKAPTIEKSEGAIAENTAPSGKVAQTDSEQRIEEKQQTLAKEKQAALSDVVKIEMPKQIQEHKHAVAQKDAVKNTAQEVEVAIEDSEPQPKNPYDKVIFQIKKGSLQDNLKRLLDSYGIEMIYEVSLGHTFAFNQQIEASSLYVLVDRLVAPHKLVDSDNNRTDQVRYMFYSGTNVRVFYESEEFRKG